ncbi:MAG: LysE family transporter [Rhizomicrobium sp.]|jgi:threonine efflux protein
MSPLSLLLSLLAVDLLAVISPGPAFVMVSQTSVRHGARTGIAAVFGIVIAVWIWCAVVLSGLTFLFQIAPWLYGAMKLAGGAYLIYLGLNLLRARADESASAPLNETKFSSRNGYMKGLLVGLTNPKAVVYFSSIFTLFVKPGSPVWLQAAAVGIATFDTLVWYGLVGVLFSRPAVRQVYGRLRHWIERAAGAVMVAFGARLILAKD